MMKMPYKRWIEKLYNTDARTNNMEKFMFLSSLTYYKIKSGIITSYLMQNPIEHSYTVGRNKTVYDYNWSLNLQNPTKHSC